MHIIRRGVEANRNTGDSNSASPSDPFVKLCETAIYQFSQQISSNSCQNPFYRFIDAHARLLAKYITTALYYFSKASRTDPQQLTEYFTNAIHWFLNTRINNVFEIVFYHFVRLHTPRLEEPWVEAFYQCFSKNSQPFAEVLVKEFYLILRDFVKMPI